MIKLHNYNNYVIRTYTILAIITYTYLIILTIQIFTCVVTLTFELFQTKIMKMTSLKKFLVLVSVHEGKNNYSLVLVLVKMEYYI